MQLLTFLLNGVKFGIPVNDVESIETRMNVVNIPNSLPQVHGIMNLHGEVIAVYSLAEQFHYPEPVSYTHLRAHETDSYLVCRLLLEKKKQ